MPDPVTTVLHLTSSRFYGGPERQMLGLAEALRPDVQTVIASFSEDGLNRAFLDQVRQAGFPAVGLENDTPHLLAARNEIRNLIKDQRISHLFCHGYKAGLVGWWAARKAGIPVMAVSRGWTGECWKVRAYEALDKRMLRRMDRVICVSQAQADKVRQIGVPEARIAVIPNAIDTRRFENPNLAFRQKLLQMFPERAAEPKRSDRRRRPIKSRKGIRRSGASLRRTGRVAAGRGIGVVR